MPGGRLLRRISAYVVPVWDYVLMTEPLTGAQLAALGWRDRRGAADLGNQFHYFRLTRDNRVLWGGYDAVYYNGGRVREEHVTRPATFAALAAQFFAAFPQLEGVSFTHAWGGVIDTCSRFCAFFGRAHTGRLAYATGYTGLGVGASRFAAQVLLDKLHGEDTERDAAVPGHQQAVAVPAGAVALSGNPGRPGPRSPGRTGTTAAATPGSGCSTGLDSASTPDSRGRDHPHRRCPAASMRSCKQPGHGAEPAWTRSQG